MDYTLPIVILAISIWSFAWAVIELYRVNAGLRIKWQKNYSACPRNSFRNDAVGGILSFRNLEYICDTQYHYHYTN